MREMFTPLELLLGYGLAEDVFLITDGRFSGSNKGGFVGHISPEAAEGGPLAIVKNGDKIRIDIPNRNRRSKTGIFPSIPVWSNRPIMVRSSNKHKKANKKKTVWPFGHTVFFISEVLSSPLRKGLPVYVRQPVLPDNQ